MDRQLARYVVPQNISDLLTDQPDPGTPRRRRSRKIRRLRAR